MLYLDPGSWTVKQNIFLTIDRSFTQL